MNTTFFAVVGSVVAVESPPPLLVLSLVEVKEIDPILIFYL